MGTTGSKDGVPMAWGATVNRGKGKKQKKAYTQTQLEKLDAYLEKQKNELRAHIGKLQKEKLWNTEYDALKQVGRDQSTDTAKTEDNLNKNRYTNILAYDHSRVKITPTEANGYCDYVNANYLDGFNRPNAYIAAQGPVPPAFNDFWQMIWETSCQLIVMVTNEVEGNKLKCHRYWPSLSEVGTYGQMEVECLDETATTTHITRTFMIQNLETKKRTKVTHLQFILWPDHGVPKSASEILAFRDEIYRISDTSTVESPLVIHCSAGVGRTGTYIALDRLICMAESLQPKLDVQEVVRDLRKNRCFMVQTLIQYGFVYISLLEALTKGHKEVKKALTALVKIDEELKVSEEAEDLAAEINAAQQDFTALEDSTIEEQVATLRERAGTVEPDRESARMDTMLEAEVRETARTSAPDEAAKAAGYLTLQQRMESYHSKRDQYSENVQKVEKAWLQNEAYLTSEQLTPIESRLASMQAQKEAFATRGDLYRKQVRDATLDQLAKLQARIDNLEDSWKAIVHKGSSTLSESEYQLASKLPLAQRVQALRISNTKGTTMGKVIITEEEIQEMRRKEEEKEAAERKRKEEERLAREAALAEAQRKAEEEKAKEPERDTHEDVIKQSTEQDFVPLKQAPEKKKELHPMVLALAGKKN